MMLTALLESPLDIAIHKTVPLMTAGGGGPVDVDITFFIYLAIFLACWALLKLLLFDPWVKVRDAREKGTEGSRAEADEMNARAEQKLSEYQQALAQAREEAAQARAELKGQGLKEEASLVDSAREKAADQLMSHRETLDAQIEAASAEIKNEAQRLGSLMSDRLMPQ